MKSLNVTRQADVEEVPMEILAQSIVKIAEMGRKALNSGLKLETLVLLLHNSSKVRKPDIRAVLNALPELEKRYVQKKSR